MPRRLTLAFVLAFVPPLLLPTGCHSAFVDATIQNRSSTPVTLVELDYPSASFGTQSLAPGQDFRYRFKVLGSGPLKLLYTASDRREQTSPGPTLNEGDEGVLTAAITPKGVAWTFQTTRRAP